MTIKEAYNSIAKEKINSMHNWIDGIKPKILNSDIEHEIKFHNEAIKISQSDASPSTKKEEMTKLFQERAKHIRHTPVGGLMGTCLFFNMKQIGLPPTPANPLFNVVSIPGLSVYKGVGSNSTAILLDPKAIAHVPKEVLKMAGDLSGKDVELFLTVVNGNFASSRIEAGLPINLHTHRWTFPNSLPGDDQTCDVNMGIFPEVGVTPHSDPGSVAFNSLSPMQVIIHPDRGSMFRNRGKKTPQYTYQDMLDSPNNAFLKAIPGSPFGVLWAVTKKDNRVAITKMIVIFDGNHPICKPYLKSVKDCYCLETHLERLQEVHKGIENSFVEVIQLFKENNHLAMQAFGQLPLTFQHGIFKETWLYFKSPTNLQSDFGKASFLCQNSLDAQYHCTSQQKAEIIRHYVTTLQNLMVNSQNDLLLHSQTLIKADNVFKLLQCANKQMEFDALEQEEQKAVHRAIWELSGCPRGNSNFGKEKFESKNTDPKLKMEALVLAASTLKPSRQSNPIFEDTVPVNNSNISILEDDMFMNNSNTPIFEDIISVNNSNTLVLDTVNQETSPKIVLENIQMLVFNEDFGSRPLSERTNRVNALLKGLPQETQNQIHGRVYELSVDPSKRGR